jgi:hypothetical protein
VTIRFLFGDLLAGICEPNVPTLLRFYFPLVTFFKYMRSIPTELAGVPVWLMLFAVAGFLLFFFKIAGNPAEREKLSKLRLFFLISTILFAVAGIADFVIWASPPS